MQATRTTMAHALLDVSDPERNCGARRCIDSPTRGRVHICTRCARRARGRPTAGVIATLRLCRGRRLWSRIAAQRSGTALPEISTRLRQYRYLAIDLCSCHGEQNSHDVFGGSGLGLFVSRQLCSLMGGKIGVQSAYGQGATFGFFVEAQAVSPPTPNPSALRSLPTGFVSLSRQQTPDVGALKALQ